MNIGELKTQTAASLAGAKFDPKLLVLIHSGVTVAVSLILSLVSHLLESQIDGTGGLGGVGMRSVLETAQMVLMLAQAVAVLFWQIGLTYCAMVIGRGQEAQPRDLLTGFRRFGPVLRLRLLTGLRYFAMAFAGAYLASFVFGLTPWAAPLAEAIEIGTEEALLAAMEAVAVPMTVLVVVIDLALLLPCWYGLRLADYWLMDHPKMAALVAMRVSRMMTYRKRLQLLKLDLSFWWFYGLELLIGLIAYGDLILPLVGVELPWSATVSFYVFLVICYGFQLALYWWRGAHVQVTYARFYEALLPKEEETVRF